MSRLIVVLIAVVGLAAGATSAAAQQDNGPYAPFPEGVTASQADAYYAQLGVRVSERQVRDGVLLGSLRGGLPGAQASGRAGVAAGGTGLAGLLAALTLTAGGLAVAVRTGRARVAAA